METKGNKIFQNVKKLHYHINVFDCFKKMIEISIKQKKGQLFSQLDWTNYLCLKFNYYFNYNDYLK
jgi:hypothetical protein